MCDSTNRRLIKVKEYGRNIKLTRYCPKEICKMLEIDENSKFLLDIDEFGFIKTGNIQLKTDFNIIFIGDSFVENLFVNHEKRFISITEREIRQKFNINCNIYNAGMSGNHLFSIIFTTLSKIIPLNPSFIFLILPSIDLSISRLEKGYWNEDKNYSIFYKISDQRELLNSIDITKLREKNYFLFLDLFINILNIFSINYYICNRPYSDDLFFLNEMNKIVKEYCSYKKYNFIDLDFYVRNSVRENIDKYFYDKLHLNEKGSLILGNILTNCIYENILSKTS